MKKILYSSLVVSSLIFSYAYASDVEVSNTQKTYSIVKEVRKEIIEKNLLEMKKTPLFVISPEDEFLPITYETIIK